MADQGEKSNDKRQHDSVFEPEKKLQKLNNHEDEEEEEAAAINKLEPAPFTNICSELLLRIFNFLDLKSLLNVAHTCKQLQNAAITKFTDDHGKKRICFYIGFNEHGGSEKSYLEFDDEIRIYDIKFCLPFVRCFGANIADLSINHRDQNERNGIAMDRYINHYCADTLTSISFVLFHCLSNDFFNKPYKNVKKVQISRSHLRTVLPNFLNWFPNLCHLELEDFLSIDNDHTAVSFPHLDNLKILVKKNDQLNGIEKLLHANQKLQSLFLRYDNQSLTKLLDMITGHTLLTKLQIWKSHSNCVAINVTTIELLRLAKEHPTMVNVDLQAFLFSAGDAILLIGQLPLLKFFKFRVNGRSEYECVINQLDKKWRHFKFMNAVNIDHYVITLMC